MRYSQLALWWFIIGSTSQHIQGLTSMQTGPGTGSSYASSLMTDGNGNVYLVGSTYDPNLDQDGISNPETYTESSCFVLAWQMDDGPTWESRKIIGHPNIMDSCHGVGLINPQALALIGNSEPGGLYANPSNTMTGWAAILNKETLEEQSGTVIEMSDNNDIPYPISVVSDGTGVYSIALTTTDSEPSEHYNTESDNEYPNWIEYEKYGSSFDMTVMKFNYNQPEDVRGMETGVPTLDKAWHQEFPFNPEEDGRVPRVYLSGLILKNDNFLIVSGSTWGKGDGYGNARGSDEDGFITLLDLETGELASGSQHNQRRIGSAADDVVTGICDNPNDPNSFFIVGATNGDVGGMDEKQLDIVQGSQQAFIMKINVNTLSTVWTAQIGAINGNDITFSYGMSCFVDEDVVYFAGQVEDGAGMVHGSSILQSNGADDIWVAKISDQGSDYEIDWVQQVGTSSDDHLARYGGLIVDWDRNPVIYGDTTGSLARTRGPEEKTADVFVMTLDRNYVQPDVFPPPIDIPGDGVGVVSASGVEGVQTMASIGSVYASGMVFDSKDDKVYLVGNTYDPTIFGVGDSSAPFEESNCFLASIDLDDWNHGDYALDESTVFGTADVLESCHGLGLLDSNTLIMAGNSEPGGLYANDQTMMSGFAATMDKNFFEIDSFTSGLTFEMSDSQRIPYPMSIATDEANKVAYMMALTSTDDSLSSSYNEASSANFPNWIEFEKYGSSYDMTVMKVDYSGPQGEIQTAWKHEFPLNPESNGVIPRVYLGGLIVKDSSFLIVVGSTRGLGEGYGNAEGDDEDGFITLFDLESGDLLEGQVNQKRIGSAEDDVVAGICDNPDDANSFYIVGATRGDMGGIQHGQAEIQGGSLIAFVQKINVKTLRAEWTLQLGAVKGSTATTAFALDCVASDGGLYVAGNVKDGAGMVHSQEVMDSNGGDDIWVARLEDIGRNFEVSWFKQLGTTGDDHLARFGGIVTDADGNAIVYGDTTGSMFRDRDNENGAGLSEIFVMRLGRDEFNTPVEFTNAPELEAPAAKDSKVLAFAIVVLVALVLSFTCCAISRRRRQKLKESQKTSVFNYLQPFDVEDIDLRKSPPGGWHGTYLNKLAYGIDDDEASASKENDAVVFETASLSHSSIVKDSLFLDTDDSPTLGGYSDEPCEDRNYGEIRARDIV